MQLKKRFGQHFLKDPKNAERISQAITGWGLDYNHLVEIGPGGGVLTQFLVRDMPANSKLTLVEIDRDLIDNLKITYAKEGVFVENIDFLKVDISAFEKPFAICGNFPYNISSQIVFKILENRVFVPEMVGMFQKEVAQRIAAPHGSKTYGILSVLTKAYYTVDSVFTLKPGAFNPPPKVDSMVIRMQRYRTEIEGLDEAKFFALVKAAFNQRRKTLRNSIAGFLTEKNNLAALNAVLQLRPEQLSVEDFIDLCKEIHSDV